MNSDDATRTYEGTVYSNSGNRALLAVVPSSPRKILDLGCGAGDNARLLSEAGHEVWGVTASQREAEMASRHCRRVVICDIEREIPSELPTDFDLIFCSHVLEHLRYPADVLERLAKHLLVGGNVAIAVPNMAGWRIRARILRGDWTREDHGPFDRTHLHFWSYRSLGEIVAEEGPFEIIEHTGDFSVPLWPLRRFAPQLAAFIDHKLGPQLPNLMAGQTILLLRKKTKPSSA